MKFATTVIVAAAGLASSALAHVGRGVPGVQSHNHHHHDHAPRAAPTRSIEVRSATNEAEYSTINNPTQECTPYNFPPVAAIVKNFPTVWDTASILPGDTEAQKVFNQIKNSGIIPAGITPRGTHMGDFSGVNYPSTDPACWWSYSTCTTPKDPKLEPDLTSCPEHSTWGLTFDDGPNCTHNAFYDFLAANKQKATMFYIGSNVLDWPLEAQPGIVDGHHICVHTWSHQYMTSFADENVFAELYYTAKAIKDVVGVTPTCWRPPYGDVDDRVRAIAKGLGLQTVLWSDDTDDWKIAPAGTLPTSAIQANYASIISKYNNGGASAGGGNIVLTHEINNIKNVFRHIVPLTACRNVTKPYPENIIYQTLINTLGVQLHLTVFQLETLLKLQIITILILL